MAVSIQYSSYGQGNNPLTALSTICFLRTGDRLAQHGKFFYRQLRNPSPIPVQLLTIGINAYQFSLILYQAAKDDFFKDRIIRFKILQWGVGLITLLNLQALYFERFATRRANSSVQKSIFERFSSRAWQITPHLIGIGLLAHSMAQTYRQPVAGCIILAGCISHFIAQYIKIIKQWDIFLDLSHFSIVMDAGERAEKINTFVQYAIKYFVRWEGSFF